MSNTPETRPHIYSQDSAHEEHNISGQVKDEALFPTEVETKEEESLKGSEEDVCAEVTTDLRMTHTVVKSEEKEEIHVKTEEFPIKSEAGDSIVGKEQHVDIKEELLLEIGPDGRYVKEHHKEGDDLTNHFSGEDLFCSNVSQGTHSPDKESSPDRSLPIPHYTAPIRDPTSQCSRNSMVEQTYICAECGKCFAEKAKLMVHEIDHKRKKQYRCPECGMCFRDQTILLNHQKNHSGKIYTCSECGVTCTKKSYLLSHRKSHSGKRVYPCPECTKVFSTEVTLLKHQQGHLKEKPYSCLECGKRFAKEQDLANHRESHESFYRYPCPDCRRCFCSKADLLSHQRVHQFKTPYSCLDCGRCFASKNSFLSHRILQLGVNVHTCLDCGKSFARSQCLLWHRKIHHDNAMLL